jgi:hypothetical protein
MEDIFIHEPSGAERRIVQKKYPQYNAKSPQKPSSCGLFNVSAVREGVEPSRRA